MSTENELLNRGVFKTSIKSRDVDGSLVHTDINKLSQDCIDCGASIWVASEIASELAEYVHEGMSIETIKRYILELLEERDPKAAERYKTYLNLKVRTSKLTIEPFDKKKIMESIMEETGLSQDVADQVATAVGSDLRRISPKFVSAPLIRELINMKFVEMGLHNARKSYTRVGLPVYEVTKFLEQHDKENANLLFNPETVHKRFGDSVSKEYALVHVLPTEYADAHMQGIIHIHDLDYFVTRSFCQSHDMRFFFKNGLKVDGTGRHTSIAAPAKHAEVAILHAAKVLAAAQTNWAGGQGLSFFTVFLAPYLEGLSYKRIKQLMQMFIYEMSQTYVARGGQTVFSSVELELGVPKHLQDLPAIYAGKKKGVYGDYEDTVRSAYNAYLDVMLEGDSVGKPFEFPKPEIVIRKYWIDKYEDEYRKAAELSAKFGSSYFLNLMQPYMGDTVCSQCCRVLLTPNEKEEEDLRQGTMRMGSLHVNTVNLPRIAYDAEGDDDRLYELLRERMELTVPIFQLKRDIMKKRIKNNAVPFAAQEVREGETYLNVDNQSLPIGFIGLNEMLKAHTGYEMHETTDAWRFGLNVLNEMSKIKDELIDRTGLRFGLLQTPAESAAYRLARLDLAKYNSRAVVQGEINTDSVYYTNSSHANVAADIPLWKRIKLESAFHPLTAGGAILHVWMGESNPNADALHFMNYKIAKNTLASYWAFTKDITMCNRCNGVYGGVITTCPNCNATNEDIEYYSRITGYYQKISGWNAGKLKEWQNRNKYSL